jgi:hypothetical protein
MKGEPRIESRFQNLFHLDKESYHNYMDKVESSVGRYPNNFRHLENYESYRVVTQGASIQDYHEHSKPISMIPDPCSEQIMRVR